jgi:hydroxypyruvate reductase/glycerate 2-kinase
MEMRRRLSELTGEDLFLFVLTGGASALMEEPQPPVTLADLRETTQRLMFAGVSIERLNAVRKHLSLTKGGRLAQSTRARGIVLVISDVVGDDLGVIGSAPFCGDTTTFGEVRRILGDAGIWEVLPPSVRDVVQRGLRGEISETPRDTGTKMEHVLIGNNRIALLAAREKSRSLGIPPHLMTAS